VSPSFGFARGRHISGDEQRSPKMIPTPTQETLRRSIMKAILSALVALSLLAGVAAPASAYPDYDRQGSRDAGQSSPL
jgi:hypothetical protein